MRDASYGVPPLGGFWISPPEGGTPYDGLTTLILKNASRDAS